ncbi:waprin-Phi1-like [Crotalus adamanteus]|uniref:Waprin-Phi1-like n=1 Tax=Crotalus adamanteus TaxID=8729 RepID=A0AAW1BUJ9_CROAD
MKDPLNEQEQSHGQNGATCTCKDARAHHPLTRKAGLRAGPLGHLKLPDIAEAGRAKNPEARGRVKRVPVFSFPSPPPSLPLCQPHLGELKAWPEAGRIPQLPSGTTTMTPRRGSCPLLLFSLVGLLVTCAQEPDTARQNTTAAAEKAGICPQAELETPNGNCTEECQSDASCEGNQKCCQTGCGTSCQIPDGIPKGFLLVPAALPLINSGY